MLLYKQLLHAGSKTGLQLRTDREKRHAVIRENWLLKAVVSLLAGVKKARIDIP